MASAAAMTKVLHVIAGVSTASGGPTTALLSMLDMLQGSGVHCSVAVGMTEPMDQIVLERLKRSAVELHMWPRERISRFAYSRGFSRDIGALARGHDVIHIHSMWNWISYRAATAAREAGVPVVFRPAGALDEFDVQKHAWLKKILGPLFLRRLFQPPNVFHCTARQEAEHLVTYGGRARRETLPLAVPAVTGVEASVRAATRQRLDIPTEAPVVLFMSRFNYKKGLELLLPALAKVRASGVALHFILAGAGEPEIQGLVDSLIARHDMAGWTHQAGFVEGPEKSAMLAASDVFVLPSQNENFGVSVVEALSAGLPALVSPFVYIAEEIGPSAALVVCDRSVEGIARALENLLGRNPAERLAADAEARALWARHFSPEVLRSRYVDFYRRVISGAQTQ